MATMRAAVVGLGTMGSMTAWRLASQGVDVTGYEQYTIGHDRSAVGGESRMFRTAYMEGGCYVPLLRASRRLFADLERESRQRLVDFTGALMIGPQGDPRVEEVLASARGFEIDHRVYDAAEAGRLFPQHRFGADEVIVEDREAGIIRPEASVVAAVAQAERAGAQIRTRTEVEAIEERVDGVAVTAGGRTDVFDRVIVTTGPWGAALLPGVVAPVTPRRIIMTWYPTDQPHEHLSGRFPPFGRVGGKIDIFGVPSLEGTMTKIAAIDTCGDVDDPGALRRDVGLDELDVISAEVAARFTMLRPEPVRTSVHMDGYTPDSDAIVGRVPSSERISLMCGFSGHGFKLSPVMGEIGWRLVCDEEIGFDIDHLDPTRPSLAAAVGGEQE